ncbi:unnamed protein product [Echinostoma caproni]|uniref:VPS9 domain-containing protein n=1 Tax=Echinostoma caproni TaxID=27848 RepID=A0A183ABI0_9TREM|nr:unnamed protein product [Echinostoma caproni]
MNCPWFNNPVIASDVAFSFSHFDGKHLHHERAVECLRIFLQKTTGGFDELRRTLSQLPLRVPGSLIGVRLHSDSKSRAGPRLQGNNAVNETYQLVYYDPLALDTKIINPPSSDSRLTRSRSASRLGIRKTRAPQADSQSAGRSLSPNAHEWHSLPMPDLSHFSRAQKTVLIFRLNRNTLHPPILSECEFLALRTRNGEITSAPNVHPDKSSVSGLPNAADPHGSTNSNHAIPTSMCTGQSISQSQSSSGLSRSSGDQLVVDRTNNDSGNLVDDTDVCEHGDGDHCSSMRCSRSRCRGSANAEDERGIALDGSAEDLMTEDRSLNDPSSDASERSGFTSLASSAHAMRVRTVSGLRALIGQSRGSGDSGDPVVIVQTSDSPAHRTGPNQCSHHSNSDGVGKRTRFSQSVLSDARIGSRGVETLQGPSGTTTQNQLRERHSTQDSLEEVGGVVSSNRSVDAAALVFDRTRPVPRTGSVELVRSSGPGSLPGTPGYGSRLAVGPGHMCDRTIRNSERGGHDGSIGVNPPAAMRCSSLSCLPAQRYVNEADERSSGITCSSCGVRVSEATDDTEQRDLGTDDGSRVDGDSHEGDVHLDRRLDSEDREAEEDALSDLPDLSSANVSGRVTPLSITSSTSRGESPGTRSRVYNRAGLVFPNGISLPGSTAAAVAAVSSSGGATTGNPGSVRFGILDFPASLLHTHESPDVTEKFGKFELPVTRLPEVFLVQYHVTIAPAISYYSVSSRCRSPAEARSTVSDTWSTDVLPSDTEYPDGGSEYLGPEPPGNSSSSRRPSTSHRDPIQSMERLDSNRHPHHHHRHHRHHRHHCRDPLCATHESGRNVCAGTTSGRSGTESVPRHHHTGDQAAVRSAGVNEGVEDSSVGPHRSIFFTPIENESITPAPEQSHLMNETSTSCLNAPPERTQLNSSASALPGTSTTSDAAQLRATAVTTSPKTQTNPLTKPLVQDYSHLNDRTSHIDHRPNEHSVAGINSDNLMHTPTTSTLTNPIEQEPRSQVSASNYAGGNPDEERSAQSSRPRNQLDGAPSNFDSFTSEVRSTEHLAHAVHWQSAEERADESVDEMMDRYRRQSDARPHASFSLTRDRVGTGKLVPAVLTPPNAGTAPSTGPGASTSSGSPAGMCSSCSYRTALSNSSNQLRIHLTHGLRRLFSSPLVGTVLETISRQLMATELFARTTTACSPNISKEDRFFLALLDALVSDTLISQDPSLTTCIRETKRLFERLLLNTQMQLSRNPLPATSNESQLISWTNLSTAAVHPDHPTCSPSSPIECDSVVISLLNQLRAERRHRLAYLAYLTEQRNRVAAHKRSLIMLQRRCERELQVQCEYIVHKYVTTFLDSQREAFRLFYDHFTEQRNRSEVEDRGATATGQGGRSAASQLALQFIRDLIERWEAVETSRRPPIFFPVSRLDSGREEVDGDFAHLAASHVAFARVHIRRLVMEKIYQSGVWMNDPALECARDVVLHRELALLSRVITLGELQIPERYHVFEPFHSVQEELRSFGCSHLPSDMLQCLKRVIERIVATLQLACPQSVPSADDLLPVLIFTILQVTAYPTEPEEFLLQHSDNSLEFSGAIIWMDQKGKVTSSAPRVDLLIVVSTRLLLPRLNSPMGFVCRS